MGGDLRYHLHRWGAGATVALLRGRNHLPFFSAYELPGRQTLPGAAAPPPTPSSPRAPSRKPVVAELKSAFLADFLPVDHLHEHQVPGFSWDQGTPRDSEAVLSTAVSMSQTPDPFPAALEWEGVLSVLFNLLLVCIFVVCVHRLP